VDDILEAASKALKENREFGDDEFDMGSDGDSDSDDDDDEDGDDGDDDDV
jgi:hypothetical protein